MNSKKMLRTVFRLLLLTSWITILGANHGAQAQVNQEWAASYNGPASGDDGANSLALDGAGHLYVTGFSAGSSSLWDYATLKYDPTGTVEWLQRYNGSGNGNDVATAIIVEGGGHVYVTGYSLGSATGLDFVTIKYDALGAEQWVARYNGSANGADQARALAVDDSGNLYVAGESEGSGSDFDYALVKYDSAGAELWVARYNGPGNGFDAATGLAVDRGGNVCITGTSWGISTNLDFATLKYSPVGAQQWVARYNGLSNIGDGAKAIAVDSSGNVYVTGNTSAPGQWKNYGTVKYSPTGQQLWVMIYNGTANATDKIYNLVLDSQANVYVTGESEGIGSDKDIATVKYNTNGTQLWVGRYNGPANNYDQGRALAVDAQQNVYVTGWSTGLGTQVDYTTLKYDAQGVQQWVQSYNGMGNGADTARAIAVDGAGNVYVTGQTTGAAGNFFDYTTIKYNQSGAPPAVSILLDPMNPPIVIPAIGGNFNYNVTLTNTASLPQTFDAWIMLQLPSSVWQGPMVGPVNLTLPGGASIARQRTQNIAASYLPGTYIYRGYTGVYSTGVKWDSSGFTFTKSGDLVNGTEWTSQETELPLRSEPLIYPNPFNPVTAIGYELRAASHVSLRVYDIEGRIVETLVDGWQEAGFHQVPFDGSKLPGGVYFYRLVAGQAQQSGKMVLVK